MEPPRKRRRSWIVMGILLCILSLFVIIGGAVALVVSRTASSLDPVAEARTPGTAKFVAEDDTYDILLVTERRASARSSEDMICVVTLADGTEINIDGSRQASSTNVVNTESVGSFDAVRGPTEVFCEAEGGDVRFVVDNEGTVAKIALWIVLGGVVVLLLGVGLLLLGIFWKKRAPVPIG